MDSLSLLCFNDFLNLYDATPTPALTAAVIAIFFLVEIDGDTTAVVFDGDGVVAVANHFDLGAKAFPGLVDGVG